MLNYAGARLETHMKVIPVNFRTEHRAMLSTARMAMENGYVGIAPKFNKLITPLTMCRDNEGSVQKEEMSYRGVPIHPIQPTLSASSPAENPPSVEFLPAYKALIISLLFV